MQLKIHRGLGLRGATNVYWSYANENVVFETLKVGYQEVFEELGAYHHHVAMNTIYLWRKGLI
jgi:catechol-2,3-dioxygenase